MLSISESCPNTGWTRFSLSFDRSQRGIKPHPIGVGGGTCAAPFRRAGIDAVVWSTIPGTAHDANEYANIADLVSDAKVYALLFAGKNVKKV